jgi:hypothetical protein
MLNSIYIFETISNLSYFLNRLKDYLNAPLLLILIINPPFIQI